VKFRQKPDSKPSRKCVEYNMFFYKNKRRFPSANIVGELTKIPVKNCESALLFKEKTIVILYTICNF